MAWIISESALHDDNNFDADKRTARELEESVDRGAWLSRNPLRAYMNENNLGFMFMSKALSGKISAFKLQKFTLGFDYPLSSEMMLMAKVMRVDALGLDADWRKWYNSRPLTKEGGVY
jgi:hypothetical protein